MTVAAPSYHCNDCGTSVAGAADLVSHSAKVHPGLPRVRLWDGTAEWIYLPDGSGPMRLVSDPKDGDTYVAIPPPPSKPKGA